MNKFKRGKLVMTRKIVDRLESSDINFRKFVGTSIERYADCDWGNLSDEDKKANDEAVKRGDLRIFAAYINPKNKKEKIWIITEADRSYTTILFPEEY